MKKVSLVFGLVLSISLISCSVDSSHDEVIEDRIIESGEQEASIEKEKVVAIANDSIFVSIKGMTCMINCVSSVKKELRNTEGIASVSVEFDPDQEIDKATISFDNTIIDAEKIKSIIETINGGQYAVTEIKSAMAEAEVTNADDSASEGEMSSSSKSSISIVDQVQNFARMDFELPNIFQILNVIF